MKLTITHRSAAWALFAAAAARMFLSLAVGMPATHNGAWRSALLGGMLMLPLVLCFDGMRRVSIALYAVSLLGAVLDAAAITGAVTRSAGYLALTRVPTVTLALPVGLAALWCVCRNGDAIGRGAMAWARIFPALLLIVVALQAKRYRPEWLAPVLGDGWRSVIVGGIRSAGCVAPAASVLLVSEPTENRREAPILLLCATGVAAILLALRLMMTPTMPLMGGWLNRLDTLLTNGRAPLYLQLPMIAMWYAGLMHALACDCFAAASLMQRMLPRLDGRVCAAATMLIACALSFFPGEIILPNLYPWLYILVAAAAALAILRKGAGACAG